MTKQIKSKERVSEYGEVFTNEREVKAMLDLVKNETNRIESTFLEPACGDGNFLAEIITRKLKVISSSRKPNYKKDQPAYEKALLVAVGSIYGIDIMQDNVNECVERLYKIIIKEYEKVFKKTYSTDVEQCIKFILSRNIVCGNALDMKDSNGNPLKFSEWKNPFNGWINRKEYAFEDLLEKGNEALPLSDTQVPYYIPKEIYNMEFTVICGNPPYQLETGGSGRQAKPIYNLFVEQAKRLNPKYLIMIMPSRWFSGGMGLDSFRNTMLHDKSLKIIVDYPNSRDVFSGVDIAGGVCYFLRDSSYNGDCTVTNVIDGIEYSETRSLDEYSTFVRFNQSLPIVRKILSIEKPKKMMEETVSPQKPFGLSTNYKPLEKGIPCQFIQKIGKKYADPKDVTDANKILDKYKLVVPRSPIAGQTDFTKPVGFYYDGNTYILEPGECCTESFIVAGAFDTMEETLNFKSYLFTKTVRFLLLQAVVSQDVLRNKYCFVPALEKYDIQFTDDILRERWNITEEEWTYIDSKIHNYGK